MSGDSEHTDSEQSDGRASPFAEEPQHHHGDLAANTTLQCSLAQVVICVRTISMASTLAVFGMTSVDLKSQLRHRSKLMEKSYRELKKRYMALDVTYHIKFNVSYRLHLMALLKVKKELSELDEGKSADFLFRRSLGRSRYARRI